jgi:hypothetical protein
VIFTFPVYIVHDITQANVGNVLSIVKLAHVLFPALSTTINTYVFSQVIRVHEIYVFPFSVAHEIFASLKVIVLFHEEYAHDITQANVGMVLSIIKVAHVVFPRSSVTINVCTHSLDIVVPLVYMAPSNVAHERLGSLKEIVIFHE